MANEINWSMWQHLTWCGEAWKPKHFFFSFGLTVFTIYNATKSTWLGKRIGGQKIDPFDNLKGMLLHILISYEKKICGVQMVKSLKILKYKWKMTPIPNFSPSEKKTKTKPLQIYQSEIVDAWNFILLFPACIMVG